MSTAHKKASSQKMEILSPRSNDVKDMRATYLPSTSVQKTSKKKQKSIDVQMQYVTYEPKIGILS